MKKIALLLVLLMLLGCLAACGGEADKNDGAGAAATGEAGGQQETSLSVEELEEICEVSEDGKHQFKEEVAGEPNCTQPGLIIATCEHCEFSTTKEIPALGHQGTGASCEEPSICTVCGELAEAPWGHDPEGGICKNCGIDVIETPAVQQPTEPETTEPETTEAESTEPESTEATAAE